MSVASRPNAPTAIIFISNCSAPHLRSYTKVSVQRLLARRPENSATAQNLPKVVPSRVVKHCSWSLRLETRKAKNMSERREPPKKGGRGRAATTGGAKKRAAQPAGMAMVLLPGLRDRLFKEMDGAKIPKEGRVQYLCSMTGRKPETVRRWI